MPQVVSLSYSPSVGAGLERLSPSRYSSCTSVDEVCNRFSHYHRRIRDIANTLEEFDATTVINQGTSEMRQPQLGFHSVHGANVIILQNGRVARRRESFCKGLAFSNRPITVDENVCIRLIEVATNWSGVLRFGVTNIDPDSYIRSGDPVPKFACPDLTAKEGYWAKALPEKFSVEDNILHFYVNAQGELHYGINGQDRGLFLTGINSSLPMWLIVDIYGNSVALEFVDSNERLWEPLVRSQLRVATARTTRPQTYVPVTIDAPSGPSSLPQRLVDVESTHFSTRGSTICFHTAKGQHVSLSGSRRKATRDESEYTQGYVFTNRPIRNNEWVKITVESVQLLYEGGLAFGVTCCDPSTLNTETLPDDSSDLIEMPQYWVGIKDIAMQPTAQTVLWFFINDAGEVKFAKDNGNVRTILHVDNTLELYMYFDVYGSTQSISITGPLATREVEPLHTIDRGEARIVLPPRTFRNDPTPSAAVASRFSAILNENRTPRPTVDEMLASIATPPERPLPQGIRRSTVEEMLAEFTTPPERPPPRGSTSTRGTPPPIPEPTYRARRNPPPLPVRSVTSASSSALQSVLLTTDTTAAALRRSMTPTGFQSSDNRPPTRPAPPVPSVPTMAPPALPVTFSAGASSSAEIGDECLICMEAPVNSALYQCGHMCMCYSCAIQQKTSSGTCPICRDVIKDVIRTYKS